MKWLDDNDHEAIYCISGSEIRYQKEVIARNVKYYRENRGLTKTTLALMVGRCRAMIADLEHAKTNPRLSTLVRVAEALDVELINLVTELPCYVYGPDEEKVEYKEKDDKPKDKPKSKGKDKARKSGKKKGKR